MKPPDSPQVAAARRWFDECREWHTFCLHEAKKGDGASVKSMVRRYLNEVEGGGAPVRAYDNALVTLARRHGPWHEALWRECMERFAAERPVPAACRRYVAAVALGDERPPRKNRGTTTRDMIVARMVGDLVHITGIRPTRNRESTGPCAASLIADAYKLNYEQVAGAWRGRHKWLDDDGQPMFRE